MKNTVSQKEFPHPLLSLILTLTREFSYFQVSKEFKLVSRRNDFWRELILTDFYQLITDADLQQFSPEIWKNIYSILFRFLKKMTPLTDKELTQPKGIEGIIIGISTLRQKNSNKMSSQSWIRFILGNLLRWQPGELTIYNASCFFHKAVNNKPPLALAWPMLAKCVDQLFVQLFQDNNNFQKLHKQFYTDCFSGTMRLIFFVTHDPAVAFFLGNIYQTIDEPKKAVYWFKTALNFGVSNKYQQPPTPENTNYKMKALGALNDLEIKSVKFASLYKDQKSVMELALKRGHNTKIPKTLIDFHLKHFDYVFIIGNWQELQRSKKLRYQNLEQAIDGWIKKMREITNPKEKHARAEGILKCLDLRIYTSPLGKHHLKVLPDQKAKDYYLECSTVLKATAPTLAKMNPYCRYQYRFIGPLPTNIPNIVFKGDIDPILKNLNKKFLAAGKKTISWEIVNSMCVKTTEPFQTGQVAELRNQLKGYKISFQAGNNGAKYLLLHNVDALTFEDNPGKEFRFR